jgi:hypothetical protein
MDDIDSAVKELNLFGINDLGQLDVLITEYTAKYDFKEVTSVLGFMRFLMMLNDIEGYFSKVYKNTNQRWGNLTEKATVMLEQKYNRNDLVTVFNKFDLGIK